MKHNFILGILTIGLILSTVVGWLVVVRVDRFLEYKAVTDCANDYHVEMDDTRNHTKTIRPLESAYKECLWNKGITKWYGTK